MYTAKNGMTIEDVKHLSPRLADDPAWHSYVNWFWRRADFRDNYHWLALGFEMGSREYATLGE